MLKRGLVSNVTQVPTYANDLFDHDFTTAGNINGLVTKYFYEASFGQYIVLGDYYPIVISVPCSLQNFTTTNSNHVDLMVAQLNNEPGATLVTANAGLSLPDLL